MPRLRASALLLALVCTAACQHAEPPKRFTLKGQVLAVGQERQELTVRHEDIEGYMPGMTMTFPVVRPTDLDGRVPGEIITATLEVSEAQGRLTDISRTGTAPLPTNANEIAMATELLSEGDPVPDAAFVDQADRRRSFAEWTGALTVVNFVYTTCPLPNFCPLMDQNFATIQNAIAEDTTLRGRVKLISISIDPEHDTPTVLAAHAKTRRSDPAVWTWLTGDRVTIEKFAGRFGVGIVRAAASADISHNLRTALIDPSGRVRRFYSGSGWTPGEVLADLRRAATAK